MTTWNEFKKQVEELGIKDDQEVTYIDWNGNDRVDLKLNNDNSFHIQSGLSIEIYEIITNISKEDSEKYKAAQLILNYKNSTDTRKLEEAYNLILIEND